MKPYFYFFVFIFILGCSGKTETTLQHISPNGKVKISIEGKRSASVESWKVNMKVNAYGFKEGQLSFEIYAEDLSDKTVTFKWADETHCNIQFKQSDGELRNFQLIASPEQLQMGEI